MTDYLIKTRQSKDINLSYKYNITKSCLVGYVILKLKKRFTSLNIACTRSRPITGDDQLLL